MSIQSVGTFTLMVLLLTIIPGPNTALILRTVPQHGHRAGILNLAGIVSGFYAHGIFSILGLSALILRTSQVFFTVKLLGSFYLLYLGLASIWRAFFLKHPIDTAKKLKEKTSKGHNRNRGNLFLEGFLTNLLNPKASMFYLAVFPQFIGLEGNPILESLTLVVIHTVVVSVWFFVVIFAVGKIANIFTSPRFSRSIQGATGLLMLYFGYRLIIYQREI